MSERCDNAHMLTRLIDRKVQMSIITSKTGDLKGKGSLPEYEDMSGIPVHRVFDRRMDMFTFPLGKIKRCLQIASDLTPDLIFCSQEYDMRLALELQKRFHVPVVLLVEDAGRINSGENHISYKFDFLMGVLGIPSGRKFWDWLCKRASAIITCHPKDKARLSELSNFHKPIYYLPWPTFVPAGFNYSSPRKVTRGIYIGSLYPFKNTQVFEQTLPRILKETDTEEFLVIGPGPHAKMIKKLQEETKNAIKYYPSLSRLDALNMIASSYYAYTPVNVGGWGFIGDCWSMKTPIVMSHNDQYVIGELNALVAKNEDDLISNINRLYDDPDLFLKLQQNGFEESKKRSANSVGDELYDIFETTLINQR